MARSKSEKEAARGLAVGLVIACALDVKTSGTAASTEATASLAKLLAAIEHMAQIFGWPDEQLTNDNETIKHALTKH
jgi:microsomal dipeptidase-like Zn-dependent dipeptidase